MSQKHPVVAVTGSSGAGTSTVKSAFEHIFFREQINAFTVEGDSFHRYDRHEMKKQVRTALKEGRHLSHFGPQANCLEELEDLFRSFGETGRGKVRRYLHNDREAEQAGQKSGTFTPWESVPDSVELLFYDETYSNDVALMSFTEESDLVRAFGS